MEPSLKKAKVGNSIANDGKLEGGDDANVACPNLPAGIHRNVLGHLPVTALLAARPVCKQWKLAPEKIIASRCKGTGNIATNEDLRKLVHSYATCKCPPEKREEFNLSNHQAELTIENIAIQHGHPIRKWSASKATDFSHIFGNEDLEEFNESLAEWDVSSATNMPSMFYGCCKFNQDLSNWQTSHVETMCRMFGGASTFNGDITQWQTFRVTGMSEMFHSATNFNQDISHWDTSQVRDMTLMFARAATFNQDISTWNVANVEAIHCMFSKAVSFGQDLNSWGTFNVRDMTHVFANCTSFNRCLSHWGTSNVVSMNGMFIHAKAFNQDLSKWDTSNVTCMCNMFNGAEAFNGNVSKWNIANVTSFHAMFAGTKALLDVDLSNWVLTDQPRMNCKRMFHGSNIPKHHLPRYVPLAWFA